MFSSVKKKAPVRRGAYGEQLASSPSVDDRARGYSTPAPWSSRPSVLARLSATKLNKNIEERNQIQPVYVSEFPPIVRQAQEVSVDKNFCGKFICFRCRLFSCTVMVLIHLSCHRVISGGIDRETSLSWMICGSKLFIWDVFLPLDKHCCVLEIPPSVSDEGSNVKNKQYHSWLISIISWDASLISSRQSLSEKFHSVGLVLVNRFSQAIVYWPEVGSAGISPIISPGITETDSNSVQRNLKSIIATSFPGSKCEGIAIVSESTGVIWLLEFSRAGIYRSLICEDRTTLSAQSPYSNGAMSLSWQPCNDSSINNERKFFVLSNQEICCYSVSLRGAKGARRLWRHEIICDDSDFGIKRDLAGQKNVWLLDMQMDDSGKEFNILVATLCKDRISGSNYTQYSLLTMHYVPSQSSKQIRGEKVGSLEKKGSPQIIIPKAKVESEEVLFTMRLRYGGKPSGSVTTLSGDGTATVAVQEKNCMRLFQFSLPWDAGRVLDASTCPSSGSWEGGTWIFLTERAGVWAITENAVNVGSVEPPEHNLSLRDSHNEGIIEDKRKQRTPGFDLLPQKLKADASGQRAVDEEAKTLLESLFSEFLSSGAAESVLQKLGNGAFEREGETNIFVHTSKYIVNSLTKHWTTRNASFISSSILSSLMEKVEKHQKFLQFLALSRCHEELSSKQS